jgi:hypothetical protein
MTGTELNGSGIDGSGISGGDRIAPLAMQVRELGDRIAISDLIDRYFLSLDQGRFDQEYARRVFSEDVELSFPPGDHTGLPGLAAYTAGFMGHWKRTHHHISRHLIALDGDRAEIGWNLFATHIHPDSPPPPASGHHFYLGGRFEGEAVRTPDGWRVRRLTLRVSWTTGDGVPSIAKVMDDARAQAAR